MKQYIPAGNFERQTSHCPTYIAWIVLDEARDYFRRPIPESYAAKLARRAEAVFAQQPFWQRKYTGGNGRDCLLMTMRHWLAAVLAKERPALFRELPDNFKTGHALPQPPLPLRKTISKKPGAARRFTHGCELLAI